MTSWFRIIVAVLLLSIVHCARPKRPLAALPTPPTPATAATSPVRPTVAIPVDPAAHRAIPEFTVPPVEAGVAYARFFVLGDMGTGHPDQYEVARGMVKRAESHGLDFIITTGDNIYENGVLSADDPQWKTKWEDVYSAPILQVPVYPSLGNHDHRGSLQAQVDYGRRNELWRMTDRHYTTTQTLANGTTVEFFMIDTTPIDKGAENAADEARWLDGELSRSQARWKFVVGHHPPYSHSIRGFNKPMIALMEPVFVKHKIDVYFAGHDHTLELLKPIKGVHYVVSGGGAGANKAYRVDWTDEAFYAATGGGFVAARVSAKELVLEFIRTDGETQYEYTIRK